MRSELLNNIVITNRISWAPLFVRLGLGAVMIGHGAQKLFGWWGGGGLAGTAHFFGDVVGLEPRMLLAVLSGGAEFFGGALVLLGLFTRPGAVLIAGNLLVAMVAAHHATLFAQNGGVELPLSLFLMAVSLMFSGGGRISVDARLQS